MTNKRVRSTELRGSNFKAKRYRGTVVSRSPVSNDSELPIVSFAHTASSGQSLYYDSWHKSDAGSVTLQLNLDRIPESPVRVVVEPGPETTAQSSVDFTFPSQEVVFGTGQTTLQFQVPIVQSNLWFRERVLDIAIGSVFGGIKTPNLKGSDRRIRIRPSVGLPQINFSSGSSTVIGGNPGQLGLVLNQGSRDEIEVVLRQQDAEGLVTLTDITVPVSSNTGQVIFDTLETDVDGVVDLSFLMPPQQRINYWTNTGSLQEPEGGYPHDGEAKRFSGSPSANLYAGDNTAQQNTPWHLAPFNDPNLLLDDQGYRFQGLVLRTSGDIPGKVRKSYSTNITGGPDQELKQDGQPNILSCHFQPFSNPAKRSQFVALAIYNRVQQETAEAVLELSADQSTYEPREDLSILPDGASMGVTATGDAYIRWDPSPEFLAQAEGNNITNRFIYPAFTSPKIVNEGGPTIQDLDEKGCAISREQYTLDQAQPRPFNPNPGFWHEPPQNCVRGLGIQNHRINVLGSGPDTVVDPVDGTFCEQGPVGTGGGGGTTTDPSANWNGIAGQVGEESSQGVQLSASLTEPASSLVTIPLELAGAAQRGVDYELRRGPTAADGLVDPQVLNILPGDTSGSVYVVPTPNTADDGNRDARVFMVAENDDGDQLSGAQLGVDILFTVTILDNDGSGPTNGGGPGGSGVIVVGGGDGRGTAERVDDLPDFNINPTGDDSFPPLYTEENTGPNGPLQLWTGSNVLNEPGMELEGYRFDGQVTFAAPGVKLRNYEIDGAGSTYGINHTNQANLGCEATGGRIFNAKTGVNAHGGDFRLNQLFDVVDAFKGDGFLEELVIGQTYMRDIGFRVLAASDPPHGDGVQITQRSAPISIQEVNFDIFGQDPETHIANTCIIFQTSNGPITGPILIEGSKIGSDGSYGINLTDKGNGHGSPEQLSLLGNIFTTGQWISGPINSSSPNPVISGNRDENGVNRDDALLNGQAWS